MKDPIAILQFLTSSVVLIRASSILVVLLMAGHLSAYPWAANHGPQETQLIDSMKSVGFEFLGELQRIGISILAGEFWSLFCCSHCRSCSGSCPILCDLRPDEWVSSQELSP